MGDIRERLFQLIEDTPSLDWLLLTKRPENWRKCWPLVPVPGHVRQNEGDGKTWQRFPNIWSGVSVEDRKYGLPRIEALLQIPAPIRFLSCEPLLEDLGEIDLTGISLVIVGGESGPDARPMNPFWAQQIRDQCVKAGVSFHFKQWGEYAPLGSTSGLDPDHFYPGRGHRVSVHSGVPMDEPTSMFRIGKKTAGRVLDGRTWDELPAALAPSGAATP